MTDPVAWYTPDPTGQARLVAAWAGAPVENTEVCNLILTTAKEQVLEYAPAPGPDDDWETTPRARFVLAQLQQARNLWNAGNAAGDGETGPDGFTFRPFPLDRTIKAVIRPISGVMHVL